MYSQSHTLVQSCWVFDRFPQQGYNLSISMDSAQDQPLVRQIKFCQRLLIHANVQRARSTKRIQKKRFPLSAFHKFCRTKSGTNVRIQRLLVDFYMPLNKQCISRTNQVSSPQSCPNNLRSRLTTRTWGLRVTSLSWRHWGKGESWYESMKVEQWRDLCCYD